MLQGRVALMSYHTQWSCGHEWEGKRGRFPVPAAIIVPPLGAYKSQLGGTYILSLLIDMVNVYCDYTSLYLYIYIHLVIYCWCFCTSDAFHIRIRNDSSEQVCDSCWIRHGVLKQRAAVLGFTFLFFDIQVSGHVFQVWSLSFWLLWWGSIVHVIHFWPLSAVYGVDLMLWPLSPTRGMCTIMWPHLFIN